MRVIPLPPSLGILRRRGVLLGSGALLTVPAIVRAQGQTGVALVIGNSAYQYSPSLRNPRNDADAFGGRLMDLGFEVKVEKDLTADGFRRAISDLVRDAAKSPYTLVSDVPADARDVAYQFLETHLRAK